MVAALAEIAAESVVITREARGLGHAEARAGAQTEREGYVAAVEVT
jgi:hypothetical protein